MKKKKIIIVGAGPGGLTAAMILGHRGFDVTVYEKDARVGGRNQTLETEGYRFDLGPTFLMMKFILDEVFEESGRHIDDYIKSTKLETMYRLQYDDRVIDFSSDRSKMLAELEENLGIKPAQYKKFLKREAKRFEKMYPCLQKSYHRFATYFEKELIQAIPYLSLNKSMFGELGKYFKDEKSRLAFTFQSKYLGMSPWDCPAAFMIIPFIEHQFGIYHTEGGLSAISEAMEKVAREDGVNFKLKTPVKRLIIEKGAVKGVELENGEKDLADETIINSDFAYSMEKLAKGETKKYRPEKLAKKNFSCSTFMLYLGVNKVYENLPHHAIVFSKDYKGFVHKIFKDYKITKDISFYIRNASITDPTLAPEGKSGLYVLVPVPNNRSGINWDEFKDEFRNSILETIENRLILPDLRESIEVERIVTPKDWEEKHNIYLGATFNLAHTINQMLYSRPRNKFEEFENCYLVGGGTHPGSGLPTIYESGRISANLISLEHGVKFKSFNKQIHV